MSTQSMQKMALVARAAKTMENIHRLMEFFAMEKYCYDRETCYRLKLSIVDGKLRCQEEDWDESPHSGNVENYTATDLAQADLTPQTLTHLERVYGLLRKAFIDRKRAEEERVWLASAGVEEITNPSPII